MKPSSPPLKAGLVAGVLASMPSIAFVLTRSSAHWQSFLLLGGVCAVVAGVCFGLYFRVAMAVVHRRAAPSRHVRVVLGGPLPDPLAEEEAELEARFAAVERGEP